MDIKVNGEVVSLNEGNMLSDLAVQLNLPKNGVAVAVNQEMVPRENWNGFSLKENDEIIIITAVCGG